jgi:hypothetical protein
MGIIERQLSKKGNQRFAATRSVETSLSPEEAVDRVATFCEQWRADDKQKTKERSEKLSGWMKRLYDWADSGEDDSSRPGFYCESLGVSAFVSYPTPPTMKANLGGGRWLATVETARREDGCRVSVTLKQWVENGDGVISNKDRYEELMTGIESALKRGKPVQG